MNGPLILPKGVIKNSSTINHSIEQLQSSPLDLADIAKLWKVYTTTKRRLLDPTAERLENYWWRIWGSRSRNLKAATVAQIFADISDGQSFVPLTSLANRDEGTPPPSYRPVRPGASSTTAIHRSTANKLGTTPKLVDPPPSILKNSESNKKTRGPSQTGPRPTARFISPHESENESVAVSPTTQVIVEPPSPTVHDSRGDKKLSVPSGKKRAVFVASGRGKRPVAVRRQSSQSSTDTAARGLDAQVQSSSERTPPQFTDQSRGKQKVQISSQDNSSSSSGTVEKKVKSARNLELKHSSPRRPLGGNRKSSQDESSEAGPSRQSRVSRKNIVSPDEITPEEMDELELQALLLAEANARVERTQPSSSQASLAQTPNKYQADLRRISDGAEQSFHQRSSTGVKEQEVAVERDVEVVNSVAKTSQGKDNRSLQNSSASTQNGLFSKRPVQPISAASIPESSGGLSRTKSQLTLLLEKDKAAHNHNRRSSSSIDLKGKKKA